MREGDVVAPLFVEACCDGVANSVAAQVAGAHRIELCGSGDGGTTPSLGVVEATLAALRVPVAVMIRPRTGDFVYDHAETGVMLRDIELARAAGASRVVTGVLRRNDTIDVDIMREICAAASVLPVTFHRAFDQTPNAMEALDVLIELGIDAVLTSGQATTALAGAQVLRSLVQRANGRITILAGGGVRAHNVAELARQASVRDVHLRGIDASVVGALVETSVGL